MVGKDSFSWLSYPNRSDIDLSFSHLQDTVPAEPGTSFQQRLNVRSCKDAEGPWRGG